MGHTAPVQRIISASVGNVTQENATTKYGAAASLSPVFAPNVGFVCISLPTKQKDWYMTTKSFCGLSVRLQNMCKDFVPHRVYSFAGAQFVLLHRFGGEVKE